VLNEGRILDTRNPSMTSMQPGQTINVAVSRANGFPHHNLSAALLNVIAVQPTSRGGLKVWPSGAPEPGCHSLISPPPTLFPI